MVLVLEEYFFNTYSKDEESNIGMKRSINFKDISNDEFSDDEDDKIFFGPQKKKSMIF